MAGEQHTVKSKAVYLTVCDHLFCCDVTLWHRFHRHSHRFGGNPGEGLSSTYRLPSGETRPASTE